MEPTAEEIGGHDIEFLAEMRDVLTAGSEAWQRLDMIIAKLETSRAAINAMDRRASPPDAAIKYLEERAALWREQRREQEAEWCETYAEEIRALYASPPAPAVALPEGYEKQIARLHMLANSGETPAHLTSIQQAADFLRDGKFGRLMTTISGEGNAVIEMDAGVFFASFEFTPSGVEAYVRPEHGESYLAAAPQPPATRSYEEGKRDGRQEGIEAAAQVADRVGRGVVEHRGTARDIATAIRALAD